jgi:hypothetical protein
MLEEGVSDHRKERMTVKTMPGPTFEVIESEKSAAVAPTSVREQ